MKPLKPTQDGVLTKYYKQRRSLEISLQGTHAEIQQTWQIEVEKEAWLRRVVFLKLNEDTLNWTLNGKAQ